MKNSDLENRLAKLTLTRPSDYYLEKADMAIQSQKQTRANLWAWRLNYGLCLCLVISLLGNFLQLASPETQNQSLSGTCNTSTPNGENILLQYSPSDDYQSFSLPHDNLSFYSGNIEAEFQFC